MEKLQEYFLKRYSELETLLKDKKDKTVKFKKGIDSFAVCKDKDKRLFGYSPAKVTLHENESTSEIIISYGKSLKTNIIEEKKNNICLCCMEIAYSLKYCFEKEGKNTKEANEAMMELLNILAECEKEIAKYMKENNLTEIKVGLKDMINDSVLPSESEKETHNYLWIASQKLYYYNIFTYQYLSLNEDIIVKFENGRINLEVKDKNDDSNYPIENDYAYFPLIYSMIKYKEIKNDFNSIFLTL
jgi:hypothetical protein